VPAAAAIVPEPIARQVLRMRTRGPANNQLRKEMTMANPAPVGSDVSAGTYRCTIRCRAGAPRRWHARPRTAAVPRVYESRSTIPSRVSAL